MDSNNENNTHIAHHKSSKIREFFRKRRQNTNILIELTRKSVKTQYRGSVLGMFWTVLNPLLNMLVMYIVFSQFFGRDPDYPIYLLGGNILFASLRASTEGALGSLVRNRGLLLRTKISPQLFPMSSVMSALVSLGFSFIALIVIMLGMQLGRGMDLFGWQIVLVFAMLPAFLMFETGVGLLLSSIYVYGRDVKHFYHIFLTLWMYMTPIFYKFDSSFVHEGTFAYYVIKCNPMFHFVQYFRDSVYYLHYAPTEPKLTVECLSTGMFGLPPIVWLYICGVAACAIGTGFFALMKRRFATHL